MENKISILSTKVLTSQLMPHFDYTSIDFLETRTIKFDIPENIETTLFTSKNAVKSILKTAILNKAKAIYCVGKNTKKTIETLGFHVNYHTDYANELGIYLLKNKINNIHFFAGNLRRDTLPNLLKNTVNYRETVVYKTELTPQKINKKVDAVLFYSPSGVESFFLKNDLKNPRCFAIGKITAATLEKYTNKIIISEKPTYNSVFESVKKHYKNKEIT